MFGGPVGAALIIAMVAASLGVLVLSAEGFDRRWPESKFGIAFVRLLPIVVTGGIAMLLFADPWVFDFGSSATLFYAALLIGSLTTAGWFRYRSPQRTAVLIEATEPTPRFPMATSQLHLMAAVAISAVLLPLGFLAGAFAALGSGDGSIFFLVLILTAVAVVIIVATSVKLDRNAKPLGAAVATGRVVAIAVAVLFVLTTVVAVLDSAS